MRFTLTLLMLASLTVLLFLPTGAAGETDLVVRTDASWREDDRTIQGDLRIASGATLELHGTELSLDGRLVIEEGARLVLGPDGGTPTVLRAASDDSRFWIQVEGELMTQGQPATRIEHVWGRGLDTAVDLVGGMIVNGSASLHDVEIGPGSGPVAAGPSGHVELQDGSIRGMGFMGLTSLGGTLRVLDSTVAGQEISISGRAGCDLRVERSTIEAHVGAFQMVGCTTHIQHSAVRGHGVGIVLNGREPTFIESTSFSAYGRTGIQADGAAVIQVHNSTFEPAEGRGEKAIELAPGNHLVVSGLQVEAHGNGGIVGQSSVLEASESRFSQQDTAAINFTFGDLRLGHGLEFEGPNPVAQWSITTVRLMDGDQPIDGLGLRVLDAAGEVVAEQQAIQGSAMVYFDRYKMDEGRAVERGPFRYVAEHDLGLAEPEGPWDPTARIVSLEVAPHEHDEASLPATNLFLAGAGAALLGMAVLVRRKPGG